MTIVPGIPPIVNSRRVSCSLHRLSEAEQLPGPRPVRFAVFLGR